MTQKTQSTVHVTKHVETRFNVDLDTKGRIFFCRTYLPEDAILELFASSLHYAYILHNLEDNQPHYHFIVHYENAKKLKSFASLLEKLSKKYPTEEGEQKSFVEIPSNKVYAFKYLTHTDPKSKKEQKFEYSSSLLKGEGFKFFDSELPQTASAIDILDDINNGVSYREMAFKYGKGFVTQYSRYYDYATAMSIEENKGAAPSTDDLFNALASYNQGQCSPEKLLDTFLDRVVFDLHSKLDRDLEQISKIMAFEKFLANVQTSYQTKRAQMRNVVTEQELIADLERLQEVAENA